MRNRLLALLLMMIAALPLVAKEAAPAAEDPALEKRTLDLSGQLRCLVCQNQTIADSNAGLAVDLRNQVREQLRKGASEREVLDFMVARYGDFVLYKPPFKASTFLLWTGPLLLVLGGLALLWRVLARRRKAAPPRELTGAERERARALLEGE
jgi:cytochrome c-type biogenesis protein CcmH